MASAGMTWFCLLWSLTSRKLAHVVPMTAGQGSEEEWEPLGSGAPGTPTLLLHPTGQRNSEASGSQVWGVDLAS